MTNPVYKIETWTAAVKDHTIGYGADIDALSVYFKEILTTGVGTFNFTVPTVKGVPDPYYYGDIAEGDKVKIWIDYDTVSGNPHFVGKVTKISGRLSTLEGYVRQISGLSQGEVLLRKFKRDTFWNGVEADDIVEQLATDLGIYDATKIETDTTSETIEVQTERYMDVLKRVSDYYDAGGSVKKDFMVDWENELIWKARPWRTTGIETLTVGDNILAYNVIRDLDAVKNAITVYGITHDWPVAPEHDSLTEATTNWTSDGAVTTNDTRVKGRYSINGTLAAATAIYLERTWAAIKCGWHNYRTVNFRYYCTNGLGGASGQFLGVHILCPDYNNRYYKTILYPARNQWNTESHPVGATSSGWSSVGSPDWNNCQGIRVYFSDAEADQTLRLDELWWGDRHYQGTASSGSADRDLEVTHDRLTSDSQCARYAETLLYQKSSVPIQIDTVIVGNPNVLVGDRLPITIPAEGITAQNYYVIVAGQSLSSEQGYLTTATMVNSDNVREPLNINSLQLLINAQKQIKSLSRDEKTIS